MVFCLVGTAYSLHQTLIITVAYIVGWLDILTVLKIREFQASSLDWPLAFGTFGLRVNPRLTF